MDKLIIDAVPSKQHTEVHIALDFDGTLAQYSNWDEQQNKVGKPVLNMIKHLKSWLAKGYKVSIFTARLSHDSITSARAIEEISKFLIDNGLPVLPITCIKAYWFTHFVDDKAYHCEKNKGIISDAINFNL